MSHTISGGLLTHIALSPQQAEALSILADGGDTARIAHALDVSPEEAAALIGQARGICKASNETHAVAIAASLRLIRPSWRSNAWVAKATQDIRLPYTRLEVLDMNTYWQVLQRVATGDTVKDAASHHRYPYTLAKSVTCALQNLTGAPTATSLVAVMIWARRLEPVLPLKERLSPEEQARFVHCILHASRSGRTIRNGDPRWQTRLSAQTWHHAAAIAIMHDGLRPPSQLIPATRQIHAGAFPPGWLATLHGLTEGDAYREEHLAILKEMRGWTGISLQPFAMYATLIWAGKLPLP